MQAFGHVCRTLHGVSDAVEKLNFSGRTDYSIIREFFRLHNIDPTPEAFQNFIDAYVFWLDHMLRVLNGEICPGVNKFIADLHRQKEPPRVGLLTGNVRLGAEIKLRHYSLWEQFEIGAFACDHEDRNELAIKARERGSRLLGRELAGDEILVIGDTPLDVACGQAINARILGVGTGHFRPDELLKLGATWAVEDLRSADPAVLCA